MGNNRTAIVTGSSRGLGKAMVKRLAADGTNVVVNFYPGLDEEAEEVVKEIRSNGGEAIAIGADISCYADVEKMVEQTIEKYGAVDILVNNAGVHRGGWVYTMSDKDWDLVIDTSLKGTFYCTKAVVPHMLENKYGRIVNISSGAGIHGFKGDTLYAAAKAGIIGFTKSLAKELSNKGILSNIVVPGLVQTELTGSLPEKSIEQMKGITPLGKLVTAEAVADGVAFLTLQNDYITGDVLCVDGGINI